MSEEVPRVETYHYVNIFETKGLEYLLLISFLVLFVLLIRYLRQVEPDQDSGENNRVL
jgi:hypothetical protein